MCMSFYFATLVSRIARSPKRAAPILGSDIWAICTNSLWFWVPLLIVNAKLSLNPKMYSNSSVEVFGRESKVFSLRMSQFVRTMQFVFCIWPLEFTMTRNLFETVGSFPTYSSFLQIWYVSLLKFLLQLLLQLPACIYNACNDLHFYPFAMVA